MANHKWMAMFEKDMGIGGFPDVVKNTLEDGLFHLWERTVAPAGSGRYLGFAIDIACGNYHHEYVDLFLDWSIARSDRALKDPRFEIESEDQKIGWKSDWYLVRHNETLKLFSLASAMRHDTEIDIVLYAQAADELLTHVLKESKSNWEDMEQSWYLDAIAMKLIVGDVLGAQALFKTRKKFKFVQRHYDVLHAFAFAINNDGQPSVTDAAVIKSLMEYFNLVRDPDYRFSHVRERDGKAFFGNMPLVRLNLALLIHKYVKGLPLAGQWEQVIGLISE